MAGRLALPARFIWASDAAADVRRLIGEHRPDVVHFHNTFYMMSPSVYYACEAMGVPVIQSLHNPRLMCASANFYRDGHLCTDCMGKTPPWPGVVHGCYRGSRTMTAAMAAFLTAHRLMGTWQRHVTSFIVFTDFYRKIFIEGGLPADKLKVKQHFVTPDPGERDEQPGSYALFVGRLDPEKGVRTMLAAWDRVENVPLKVRGGGQLDAELNASMARGRCIERVGRLSVEALAALVKGARFLVWPSEGYYETFGLVAIEAFACGVPVIASRTGVNGEIVTDGVTGLHFKAGDPDDLAAKVRWGWDHPDEMAALGRGARREFEAKYTAKLNYGMLMDIYQGAMAKP